MRASAWHVLAEAGRSPSVPSPFAAPAFPPHEAEARFPSMLNGLDRVLIMVDSANGISAELPFAKWTFVPIDLAVVLTRIPDEEWLGMDARTTIGAEGIGVTDTTLFDAAGAFGRALQTLYIAPR